MDSDGKDYFFYAKSSLCYSLGLSTTLTQVSVVPIKKDRINLSWQIEHNFKFNFIGLYRSLNLSEKQFLFLRKVLDVSPIVAIVLLVLANKAIKKDEDLVKSVDRLR
jgi:hypothetical protein